jgi:hypothetical protein
MTDAELLEYSREHLDYEVWMLEETAGRLLHAPLHFDRVIKNTVVESFTIHARALTAFLYPDQCRHHPTDVAADDYVTEPEGWRLVRGDLPGARQHQAGGPGAGLPLAPLRRGRAVQR